MTEKHISYLCFCKTINIFPRIDTFCNGISVYMSRKRCLDNDSMYFFILREFFDFFLELSLADIFPIFIKSKRHTNFTSTTFFHVNICETCRVFSYEYNSEHRFFTTWRKRNGVFYIFEKRCCNDASVENHEGKVI